MPIIDAAYVAAQGTGGCGAAQAVNPPWLPLQRIDNVGGDLRTLYAAQNEYAFDRIVFAAGDAWFDKFTPAGHSGTTLLDALRLPAFVGVLDCSHIGDSATKMVTGWQRRQTESLFGAVHFDAILLSAGGADLKDLFTRLYRDLPDFESGRPTLSSRHDLQRLRAGEPIHDFFDTVITHIDTFITLRDEAVSQITRRAPLFLHGYDYLQPRPAPSPLFTQTRFDSGPWLHPSLHRAGLDDTAMRHAAHTVIDELNHRLRALVTRHGPEANLWLIDQRGLLTLAEPGSTAASGDWLDEIHPTREGFGKLAWGRWNEALAGALGLR